MLLKSVDILAIIHIMMIMRNLRILPKVKNSESARILQFLLNMRRKHKYIEKNSENGNNTK